MRKFLAILALTGLTLVATPAQADGPGVGTPWVVTVGFVQLTGQFHQLFRRPLELKPQLKRQQLPVDVQRLKLVVLFREYKRLFETLFAA